MSQLFVLFISLTAASSGFAHPLDSDDLSHIGKGTQIILQKDINIPARKDGLLIMKGVNAQASTGDFYRYPNKINPNVEDSIAPNCIILTSYSDVDRVIKAGTTLEMIGDKSERNDGAYFWVSFKSPYADIWPHLLCVKGRLRTAADSSDSPRNDLEKKYVMSQITIGELKTALGEDAVIKFPEPEPVQ